MNEPGYRKQERKAYYALIYQSGSYLQDSLFKVEDLGDQKRSKAWKQFIDREAKKRDITPLEMIDYFGENKEELAGLLKKKKIDYPKFTNIQTHSGLDDIITDLLNTKSLKEQTKTDGVVKIYTGNKGVNYEVNTKDLIKLEGNPPKVYVSQQKNLILLMGMIKEQQFKNSNKEAKCEFTLAYYAARRGYTREEIQQGGKFFNELRRDLLSGALTSYRKILIKGKKYTLYNSFYGLYVPDDPGGVWIIEFNNPYRDSIVQVLNKEAGQFFVRTTPAIEDRTTTENPYLWLFYQQLITRKRDKLVTMPITIGSLLKDMNVGEQILARPKECFKVLKPCLIYWRTHYDPIPELESFILYNNFHKTKTVKLPINISEAFKELPYEDFKELLKATGIKDIREAFISFKRPYINPESSKYKLDKKGEALRDSILKWTKEWEKSSKYPIKKTEAERCKYIGDRIGEYGTQSISELLKEEKNKKRPSAYHFLFCTLTGREDDMDWDYYDEP